MKRPTILQAVRERPVEDGAHIDYLNLESAPVLRKVRDAINSQPKFFADYTSTASGTDEEAWESEEMPDNGLWHIQARAIGIATDGSSHTAAYDLEALVQSIATVVSPVGTLGKTAWESDAALDANIGYDATNRVVGVTVNDGALATMQWRVIVHITEVVL